MANIVYALPSAPTPTRAPDWVGMRMSWTGWDGSEWIISDRSQGAVLLSGVRGLNAPKIVRFADSSPSVHGSRFRGSVTVEREVVWPIKIFHGDGSTAWIQRDRAFWRTLDPGKTGVWTVTQPDGEKRSLTLRFEDDGGHATDILPTLKGWERYMLSFVAEQPFWEGAPFVRSWKPPVSSPFFEPNGPALVNIDSAYTVDRARMDNPGDVESYPVWFIDGETVTAKVGIGSLVVNVPFAIPAGKCLVINSDPNSLGATLYDISPQQLALEYDIRKRPSDRVIGVDLLNPVDRSKELGAADFGAIPPGQNVPLSLAINGSGVIEAYLPALYRRAW